MKKLKLHINETSKDYELMLVRDSIKWLEANGFSIEEFVKKPITYYDILWTSLFLANHKEVNPNLALKIMETCEKEKGDKYITKVVKFAIEEYNSFMNALTDTDSSEKEEELEIIEA